MGNEDFTALEVAITRDWLNIQVKIYDMQKAHCRLNDTVSACAPEGGVTLLKGADYIAGLLGLELKEDVRKGDNNYFPYLYSFEYGGVRFMQFSTEKIQCASNISEEPENV